MIDAIKNYYVAYWHMFLETWWISLIVIAVFVLFVLWRIQKGR